MGTKFLAEATEEHVWIHDQICQTTLKLMICQIFSQTVLD